MDDSARYLVDEKGARPRKYRVMDTHNDVIVTSTADQKMALGLAVLYERLWGREQRRERLMRPFVALLRKLRILPTPASGREPEAPALTEHDRKREWIAQLCEKYR